MRWVQRGAALVVAGLIGGFAASAYAQNDATPIRLAYEAPPSCPSSDEFLARVRARTALVRPAEPGELADAVSITVLATPQGFVGTLELPPVGGEPFVRRVDASSCSEVVLALSLVLAVSYDPNALAPPVSAAPGPAAIPSAPAPPPPLTPVALAPVIAPPARPVLHTLAVGVSAFAMSGISPRFRAVLGPFIEWSPSGDSWSGLRIGVTVVAEVPQAEVFVSTSAGERSATLEYVGGRFHVCPLQLILASQLELSPCGAFEVGGIIGAGGRGVEASRSGVGWWLAPMAFAALRWNFAESLFVDLVAGGGIPLVREKFAIDEPNQVVVHTIPAGFAEVGGGFGVSF